MKTKYYYTLRDVLDTLRVNEEYYDFNSTDPRFTNLYEYVFPVPAPDFVSDPLSEELWCKYIYPYYRNTVIIISEEELDNIEMLNQLKTWFFNFAGILQSTFPKYKVLLKYYKDEENKLMDQVKMVSVNKFNDTPQIQNTNEQLGGDDYVSTLATAETATESSTVAVRLAEIKEVWNNLFYEWRNMFKSLFYVGV